MNAFYHLFTNKHPKSLLGPRPYTKNRLTPNKGTVLGHGRSSVIEKLVGPLFIMEGGQMRNQFHGNDIQGNLNSGKYLSENTLKSYTSILFNSDNT